MIFELFATVAAGFAGAGVAMLARRLSGGRLPRFLVPGTAGAAMLALVIWSDYAWFDRTTASLPGELVVVSSQETRAAWRPWTLAAPVTERFAAIDRASIRRNDAFPSQVMTDLLLFARRAPVTPVTVLIDCDGPRRADLGPGATLDADGAPVDPRWIDLSADDPLAGAACDGT